ncbi:MAG: molybdopterin-dependent oxidoreductase [Pseudomonadota bacterium]
MSETRRIELIVNGRRCDVPGGGTRLVDALREDLGLSGTHIGCDTAQCGACTVHLGGAAVKACTLLTEQIANAHITTIEGVGKRGQLHPVQAAFKQHHGLQCGFCTPGMVMGAISLLEANPDPSEAQIRASLSGNLCRCTGYQNIVAAVQSAARGVAPSEISATSSQRVGNSPERVEDDRFLLGHGNYVADTRFQGQAFASFVRSPHAHADIVDINTIAAGAVPGVIGIVTGHEIDAAGFGSLTCGWQVYSKDGSPMIGGARPILAKNRVRFVGDAIAMVVAETLEIANAAMSLIDVEYQIRPHNVRPECAIGAQALHTDAPENRCFDWAFGDDTGVRQALDQADHVVELDLENNRLIPNAIEPRAANAYYDPGRDHFTLYVTSQNPHMARRVISEMVGLAPEHKLRVISPDVGGGFGSKIFIYPEECACLFAAKWFGVPVKWVATRTESFLCDAHGRDHRTCAKLALDAEGRFLGLEVKTTANLGAYLSSFAAFVPSYLYGTMLAGPYTTPAVYCEVEAVYTNTAPVDAYRGAGRPEATYLLETLVDAAARQIGMDPVELRRRNLIPLDAFPYQTPVALEYDTGNYQAHLDAALAQADYKGFDGRRRAAREKGYLRGIGVSCYVEACGIAPSAVAGALGADVGLWESANLRFTPTAKLQVFTGSHSHGQGHETSFAQIAGDLFGLSFDDIEVIHGDTDKVPMGMGTYGSRSLVVGGSALVKAGEKLIAKGKIIAAHLLDDTPEDMAFGDGLFRSQSSNRGVSLKEVVHAAYVPHDYPEDLEPGLEASAFYDPLNFSYPSGTHICEVEINPSTGEIRIVRMIAVDDFGVLVHPAIVEGQVHGGLAQGIGQALFEVARYDTASGQPLTASLKTYALPRAADLPTFELETTQSSGAQNPLGAKGCGEAGAIAAPPAVMNAIADALGQPIAMPATPEALWRACRNSPQWTGKDR